MPPSVGELAESVGVLFDGALEGGGDGGVAEAGAVVGRGGRASFAAAGFAAVAGFFGGGGAFRGGGAAAFFGAGLGFFDGDLAGFAAAFAGFAAALEGLAGGFAADFFAP